VGSGQWAGGQVGSLIAAMPADARKVSDVSDLPCVFKGALGCAQLLDAALIVDTAMARRGEATTAHQPA
jgi:hypothetical protein